MLQKKKIIIIRQENEVWGARVGVETAISKRAVGEGSPRVMVEQRLKQVRASLGGQHPGQRKEPVQRPCGERFPCGWEAGAL